MTGQAPLVTEKWWDASTVAVVTGANKGIGFEIAKSLAAQGLKTVVTARNVEAGEEAATQIKSDTASANVIFHQLDITDQDSVDAFAEYVEDALGSVTILVNNAGFAYKGNTFGANEARVTLDTNFVGTARVCKALLDKRDLMPSGSRIVNVCSSAGKLSIVPSAQIREKFETATSYEDIAKLADGYVAAIAAGKHAQEGWPNTMYGMSKLCEAFYSKILAEQVENRNIAVVALNPGWCVTSMTSLRGNKTAAEGADTPVWLALQPPSQLPNVTGKFFSDRQEQPF